jgi:hypothetical protein
MAFDYYGSDISQYEIANVARAETGTYNYELARAGHFSNLSTSMGNDAPGYTCTGYTGRDLGYGAFQWWFTETNRLAELRSLINQGYPFITLMWYSSSHTNGHYRVVTGYTDTGIIAHDPWDGSSQYYSDSLFTDLWSYSNYWGMFTSPWSVTIKPPNAVATNSVFSINASITYTAPDPFDGHTDDEVGYHWEPTYCNKATISLPSGFSLIPGENLTKSFVPLSDPGPQDWFYGGDTASISWQVTTSQNAGSYPVTVLAEGLRNNSVSGHGPYPSYAYSDRIGGTNNTNVNVEPCYMVTFAQTGLDAAATGTVVTVNGSAKTYSQLPYSLWIDNGSSVTYSYSSTISSSTSGKQFSLTSVTGPSSPITVNANTNVTGNYKIQFYLTVTSPYATTGGQGWYDSGVTAYATLDTGTVDHGNGTRHVFTNWNGDATGTNYASSDQIAMNGPKTAIARWKTQHTVTFTHLGLDSSASGPVVDVNGTPVTYGQLSYTI